MTETSVSPTSSPEPVESRTRSVLDVIHNERSELQALVARELKGLGFPEQRFDIQASFLTFSPLDLGIRLVWPLRMPFQGTPTGVIQIGAKMRYWNPESRVVIPFARLMDGDRLRKEVHEFVRTQAAMVSYAYEKRGGTWPPSWRRFKVRGSITVDQMPTRTSGVARAGKVRR